MSVVTKNTCFKQKLHQLQERNVATICYYKLATTWLQRTTWIQTWLLFETYYDLMAV
jgi:hypothetical protein